MPKFEGHVYPFNKPEEPPFGPADEARLNIMETMVHEELSKHEDMDEAHVQRIRHSTVAALTDSQVLARFRESTKEQWANVPDVFAALLEELEDRGLAVRS